MEAAIVLDASVALSWVLADARHDAAEPAVKRAFDSVAHVPVLWLYEVQSVLAHAVSMERLKLDDAREACETLASIPLRFHSPQGVGREFALAVQGGLTAYDASYLCIARDLQLALATFDEPLRKAAHTLGIALF
ncbi:MAG: type II toxin-antitoxin system VapC family toxin [Candidatus Tyrphobacter sp.]